MKRLRQYYQNFGADDRSNLEPDALPSILEQLEEWEAYLKSEPEVMHKLREFERAASEGEILENVKPLRPARSRGPSL